MHFAKGIVGILCDWGIVPTLPCEPYNVYFPDSGIVKLKSESKIVKFRTYGKDNGVEITYYESGETNPNTTSANYTKARNTHSSLTGEGYIGYYFLTEDEWLELLV